MTKTKSNDGGRPGLTRLIASIPAQLRRSSDLLDDVRKVVLPRTPTERADALKKAVVWTFRTQIAAETAGADEAAKGFSRVLLDAHPEISAHAAGVPHLGALSPLAPLPATRWDYGRLLLRTLLEMKQRQPGLGLGSSNFGVTHGKAPLSGLEITQTWALLGGYGHLFGTFATERALLFVLDSTPALEQEFLRQLAPEVRESAEVVVRERDMYRFFYVIAAWRVSRWPGSATRTTSLQLLSPLLDPPNDAGWRKLTWAFRRARQIAYTRLHTMLGVDIASSPIPMSVAVRELRPLPQIGFLDESAEPTGAVSGLIDALDRFYGEVFFTSPAANERVLTHLRAFKVWWPLGASLQGRIDALMSEPSNWPQIGSFKDTHFARLQVPDSGIGWTNEVRHWLARPKEIWTKGNFVITPSRRRTDGNVIDLYVDGAPNCELVAHVAEILAERNEATWSATPASEASRRLWRSIAGFFLRLFQLLLPPTRLAHLEPVAATDGIGLAIAAKSVTSGCGRLHDFARRVEDDGRKIELDALREASLQFGNRGDVWMSFLGRLRILDEDSGRQLQEFDGVFAFIDPKRVEWHFIEHKDGDPAGMRGQLDDLAKHMHVAVPACDVISVSRGRAAHTSVTWRGPE